MTTSDRRRPITAVTGAPWLEAFGITGIGEVNTGDDVAAALLAAVRAGGADLADGDVVVVSSKVVSKAEGRWAPPPDPRADQHPDPGTARDVAIDGETLRVIAERNTVRGRARIVATRSGPVLAAAGVDGSNVPAGTLLLLPADPDASAQAIRRRLAALTGRRVGVVVSDTAGRPWREGQVDIAIGAAGLAIVDDLRGSRDTHGNALEVTVRALADEIAGLADLVKGKLAGIPVAVVRGLGEMVGAADGPGAAALLRDGAADWFRYGHVEAVRTALGVPPPEGDPPEAPAGSLAFRLDRAIGVALGAPEPLAPEPDATYRSRAWIRSPVSAVEGGVAATIRVPPGAAEPADLLAIGALAQRIAAAAWTEDLVTRITADLGPPAGLQVQAADAVADSAEVSR